MNNRGIATVESIALLTVFTTLVGYALGMFGVIHTGILHSIAARTYAWETFAQRTNVTYFRDSYGTPPEHYKKFGFRAHTISSEKTRDTKFIVPERAIAMHIPLTDHTVGRDSTTHNERLTSLSPRETVGVNPVWIKTIYGICLDNECGGVTP